MKRPISHSINLKFNCPITSLSPSVFFQKRKNVSKINKNSANISSILSIRICDSTSPFKSSKGCASAMKFQIDPSVSIANAASTRHWNMGCRPKFFWWIGTRFEESENVFAGERPGKEGTTSGVIFSLRTVKVSVKRHGDEWMP